jgi:spore coat polysaccharide biosynthesis predicted glycosyltransferase SpsG
MPRLIIRADGSRELGLGHIMRTMAYAEAARERGIDVEFKLAGDAVAVGLPSRRGWQSTRLSSADDRGWLSELMSDDTVLIDGYHFTQGLLYAVGATGVRVAMLDDVQGIDCADIVIAVESNGRLSNPTKAGAEVLHGIAYAPIRREFLERRRLRGHERSATTSLAVTLGGSDAAGLTRDVVRAVHSAASGYFEALDVVLGPASAIDVESSDLTPRIRIHRDPPVIAEVFDRATAVISAAGTTAWELACMGLPTALVQASFDQAAVGPDMEQAGAAIALGPVPAALVATPRAVRALADPAARLRMSSAALGYVDGMGADRTVDALFGHTGAA